MLLIILLLVREGRPELPASTLRISEFGYPVLRCLMWMSLLEGKQCDLWLKS